MSQPAAIRAWTITMALLFGAAIHGCERRKPTSVPAPPPNVTIAQPVTRMFTDTIEATGTTTSKEEIELRAQVGGYLQSVNYQPRAMVKKGTLLFQIDPRPYEDQLAQAKAHLEVAKTEHAFAEAKLARLEDAFKSRSVSELEVIQQRADRDRLKASIDLATARVDAAEHSLAYTRILAPLDGRVSRNVPGVGALIDPSQTKLATIVDDSIVYAYFNLSEADVLRLRRSRPNLAADKEIPKDRLRVFVGLMNEKGHPHEGTIDYWAPQMDSSTGTQEVRGRFVNDGSLMGGLFVRVRIPVSVPRPVLMVAERAMGFDQGQRYLLVANNETVEYRRVQVGALENGMRVVTHGVSEGDWVIVNGIQRAKPGVRVNVQRASMEAFVDTGTRPAAASGPTVERATTHPVQ
ncbi:MAG: efflux RND transporter periplasmic adaptor subunit [Phycisphaerae bacterium]|nr:efflux RND transporter periplasmic adaptor subunit [Phycisphaerae bacterium]